MPRLALSTYNLRMAESCHKRNAAKETGKRGARRIVTNNALGERNSSALPEVLLIFLDFKNPVTDRWILFLQQRNRDVVHRNPACRLSFQASVVGVPVKHQVGAVAINHFR